MTRQYMDAKRLPPRPDPESGLPRPPHAPWFLGSKKAVEDDLNREKNPARAPKAPPGQGPVLAWYRNSHRGSMLGAAIIAVFIAVVVTITRGFDWVKLPSVWIVILVAMLIIYVTMAGEEFSAGSEWMATGKRWVRIYELEEVTAKASGTGVYVTLRDSGGRRLEYKFTSLAGSDRLILDLTHNGILHSVISGGAVTNGLLHRTLKLPYPNSAKGKELEMGE